MPDFTIRCHPCVPVSSDGLESWLEAQVEELRRLAPTAGVRLFRLTQQLSNGSVELGWLLDVNVGEEESAGVSQALHEGLRDMRLLGLQPTVLVPLVESGSRTDATVSTDTGEPRAEAGGRRR